MEFGFDCIVFIFVVIVVNNVVVDVYVLVVVLNVVVDHDVVSCGQ